MPLESCTGNAIEGTPQMTDISRRGLIKATGALGIATSAGAAGAKAERRSAPPATLYRSESFTRPFRDRLLEISIARPFDVEPDLTQMVQAKKPVPVYVLDAVTNFPLVSSIARLMQWSGELPPCLVIGIGYHDEARAQREDWRVRELTPSGNPGPLRRLPAEAYGGAREFRHFVLDTLRPEIEQRYEVDAAQSVLVGHSFGGLFTIDTMVQTPNAFGNYLAISPSLYFDDRLVLRQLEERLTSGVTYPARIAAFVGEREERLAGPAAQMTGNVLKLGAQVAEHRKQFSKGALVSVVPEATHHSVIATAITQGLRFLISPEDRRTETF